MEVTKTTIDLIKSFEGLSLKPYRDPRGNKKATGGVAIGYGNHYYDDAGSKAVKDTDPAITVERANSIIEAAVKIRANTLKAQLNRDLTDCQFGALLSVVYNFGGGASFTKKLVDMVNADPNDSRIKDTWCSACNKRRRNAEYNYYCGNISSIKVPSVTNTNTTIPDSGQTSSTVQYIKYINTNFCDLVTCDSQLASSSSSTSDTTSGGGTTSSSENTKQSNSNTIIGNKASELLSKVLGARSKVSLTSGMAVNGVKWQSTGWTIKYILLAKVSYNNTYVYPELGEFRVGVGLYGVSGKTDIQSIDPKVRFRNTFTFYQFKNEYKPFVNTPEADCKRILKDYKDIYDLIAYNINRLTGNLKDVDRPIRYLLGGRIPGVVFSGWSDGMITLMKQTNRVICNTDKRLTFAQQVNKKQLISRYSTNNCNYRYVFDLPKLNCIVWFNIICDSTKTITYDNISHSYCPSLTEAKLMKKSANAYNLYTE